jgi:hypothetical protein
MDVDVHVVPSQPEVTIAWDGREFLRRQEGRP